MPRKSKTSESKESESILPSVPVTIVEGDAGETVSDLPAFAAGLIHEVKNPLAAIHLHLQLLENYATEIDDVELREKIAAKLRIIKREILGLNHTLQEFMRFIRHERPAQKSGTEINQPVREIVRFLEPQANGEEIVLSFHSEEPEIPLDVDPAFIKQIVLNLILNSIQAFAQSPTTRDLREIRVTTGYFQGHPFLRIADNGPGMTPEVQEKIFQPFFTTKKDGSGLGLAIVKKMTVEMGGRIELKSTPERGTEFTLLFPKPGVIGQKDG